MDFTVTVHPIANLPGAAELTGGMLVPIGFLEGQKQFGGNGVRVTGFDAGKATTCFSLSALEVANGWGGKVGMWDGAKWVLLPTTIAPVAEEASTTSTCAGITGNGTYVFIKYITDVSLLPQGPPACRVMTFAFSYIYEFGDYEGSMEGGVILNNSSIPLETPVSFQLINVVPSGFFTSGLFGSGLVVEYFPVGPGMYVAFVEFNPEIIFEYGYFFNIDSFTLRVFLPGCYTDLQYPDDLDNLPGVIR